MCNKRVQLLLLSGGAALQENTEENQRRVVSMMCTHLQISPKDLLTDDIKTHPEFMKVSTTIAVSTNQYYDLVSTWKEKQPFVKRESKVHKAHLDEEKY